MFIFVIKFLRASSDGVFFIVGDRKRLSDQWLEIYDLAFQRVQDEARGFVEAFSPIEEFCYWPWDALEKSTFSISRIPWTTALWYFLFANKFADA